ncbi:uncharacterized protein LOC109858838 [Pseudomyrmex gracilis]|uniref:uncharacterized protein LOC109858838 n=1 Tax=Pseudomyrmex gracilis TaxID=219809 RepID=UPI00099577D3|nr:uncharacterized protein LOC109858838 [Pseudomyrmex gracilis]
MEASSSRNRESIGASEETALELRKLREAAKHAAIYHNHESKFQRRTDLSHVVHAGLHCVQFVVASAIEIFHHVHHYVNERAREEDDTIPELPEERNPIFFVYPICMLASLVLAILWLVKKLHYRPLIPLVACTTGAILMLVTGIMEMRHADIYIDITEFTDEEILEHPWQWIRRESASSTDITQSSDSSVDTDVTEDSIIEEKIDRLGQTVELAPIPTLRDLSVPSAIVEIDEEPRLYCCFVDCYNYIRTKLESKPKHEFQVVHVM